LGEAYLEGEFGVSPYITGLFTDYWPDYAAANFGTSAGPASTGAINWNAKIGVGYLFRLGGPWALDLGAHYSRYWPPADLSLGTFGFRAGATYTFGLGGAP
jgi:hypothetical protein